MGEGTSWTVTGTAPGTDGYRIRLALARGDVRWDGRTSEWLAGNFDRTKYNQRTVNGMLWSYVQGGGPIRGQKNPPGEDYEFWFDVEMDLDGANRFIKFVIEPEEDDNPGIVIVSAHPPY